VNVARRLLDQRDLLIVTLYLFAAAATVFGPVPVVRAVAVIPLVLLIPGYTLVGVLFPALVVPTVERLLLSIALSVGITIVLGLFLAFTGIGLTPLSWLIGLLAISLVGLIVAAWRRVRYGIAGPAIRIATMPRMGALAVLVSALVIGNVVLGSRIVAGDQQGHPPLQLWMIPIEPASAQLGIHADDSGGQYRVVISVAGDVFGEYDPVLDPQETWQTMVQFPAEVRAQPIVARLYEAGSETEARFVVLQPVTGGV
jgi:hypothetical protein